MKNPLLEHGSVNAPLAELVRPRTLDEVVGQEHLLAPGAPFRESMLSGSLGSFVLWGPPGTGKTTLALMAAGYCSEHFVRFSAVTGGVPLVRQIVAEARERRAMGTGTMLFVDEIHRFNRAQQDAFLPHVEDGTIRLAGATTENPSFELNAPLLSRCTVYVLRMLESEQIRLLLDRAVSHPEFAERRPEGVPSEVLDLIAGASDGDGRRSLNLLEQISGMSGGSPVTLELASRVITAAPLRYDKSGEEHYNLISALHKSLRSGDVDASLYWLARMLDAGENPLYVGRRLVRFASEDVGLADPSALTVTMRAVDSYRFLGSPEGELALAEAVCYLALAPKSNSVYAAWKRVADEVTGRGSLPVPLHLRNAPTGLMRELGYGEGYQYAHDAGDGIVTHANFPEGMGEPRFWEPGEAGREAVYSQRLREWLEARRRARLDRRPTGE
jgi:putative ATPase